MIELKAVPDDFIVKEVIDLKIGKGIYSYYTLKKRDYTTMSAVSLVAKKLGVKVKDIGFAGNKDRKAVTEQAISILNGPQRDFGFKDISLKFIGRGSERINLGANEGNSFELVVRNVDKQPEKKEFIINYFDEQRFSDDNVELGKMIVKGDFKKACDLLEKEKEVADYLKISQNDYVGALKKINKKLLRLFVHAYQSFIWNATISEYLKKHKASKIKIPIAGFGTELEGEVGEIIKMILVKEKINLRDFVIKPLPELSSEGTERDLIAEIKNLKIGSLEADELNKGKKKIKISFFLQKGSYATLVVKQLFQAP